MGERTVRKKHKFIDNIELKYCPRCDKWLKLISFTKHNGNWDKLQGYCNSCRKEYNADNKESKAAHYQANKQKYYEGCKARRLANPQNNRAYLKKFHTAHPEKAKEYSARWKKENLEAHRQSYIKENRRRRATLKVKLCDNISANLYYSLKNGKEGKRTFDILGYTYKQLKQRLTKTMPKGYEWDDYMNGKLHVDHKIPIKVFNFNKTDDIDFKKCWALKNLQLLPAIDNLKKSAKLTKHFQPSLIFG